MLALLLAACATCDCLAPSGPPVDMAAATPDVEAAFAGPFAGTVADAPGDEQDGVRFEPCAIAGQPFEVTFDVAAASCTDCTSGTFPLTGELRVGDAPALPLDGSVEVWSDDDGLMVWQVLVDPPHDGSFAHQTLDVLRSGDAALDRVEVQGLQWSRRQSEDDDAVVVWEVCELAG